MKKIFLVLFIWNFLTLLKADPPTVPTAGSMTNSEVPQTSTSTTTTSRFVLTTPPDLPTAPTSIPPPQCPFQCPSNGVHQFQNPENCRMFIGCINGKRSDGICLGGFLFDVNRGNCQPADVVDCGQRPRT